MKRIAVILGGVAAATLLSAAPAASAESRIVGGTTTSIASYPWQAGLVYDSRFYEVGETDYENHFCGGSVVTTRIIITAAHCVYDGDLDCPGDPPVCPPGGDEGLEANDFDIILGKSQLSASGGARFNVQEFYIDDDYDGDVSNGDDDALVVLSGPTAQQSIKIAGSDETALWAPGANTVATGWGDTSDGGNKSDVLKQAVLPRLSDGTCAANYPSEFDVDLMLCASGVGQDTCAGDSGGPLQAPAAGGIFRLVGITSYGNGPCATVPGIYTRIADPDSGSGYATFMQEFVDLVEADQGLPDGGSIIGSGAQPPNLAAPSPTLPGPVTTGATGQRAAAMKKCKKKKIAKARKKCRQRARQLPA